MWAGFVYHYGKLIFLFKVKLAYIHYAYISQVFHTMESLLPTRSPHPPQKRACLIFRVQSALIFGLISTNYCLVL